MQILLSKGFMNSTKTHQRTRFCSVSAAHHLYLEITPMFNNLGTLDRLIRLVLASGILYLGLYPYAHSGLGIGLDIVGTVLAGLNHRFGQGVVQTASKASKR